MTYTLLEMVQRILAAMDSDEVNSINDTTESYQVALLIEGVYYDLLAEANIPAMGSFFELTASGDNTKPTLMTIPDEVMSLEWVKYDNIQSGDTYTDFVDVQYMETKDFMELINTFSGLEDDGTVGTFDHSISLASGTSAITFLYRDDKAPTYYTSFDDGTLIFDSYDSSLDTTLQKSKTQCWGSISPVFTLSDSFTPRLNTAQFSLLMNMAKARAFSELKQVENKNALRESRVLKIRLRNSKRTTPHTRAYPFDTAPNYGRK